MSKCTLPIRGIYLLMLSWPIWNTVHIQDQLILAGSVPIKQQLGGQKVVAITFTWTSILWHAVQIKLFDHSDWLEVEKELTSIDIDVANCLSNVRAYKKRPQMETMMAMEVCIT
jgi:hypothetical protein